MVYTLKKEGYLITVDSSLYRIIINPIMFQSLQKKKEIELIQGFKPEHYLTRISCIKSFK